VKNIEDALKEIWGSQLKQAGKKPESMQLSPF
jgi:hypothetical protein